MSKRRNFDNPIPYTNHTHVQIINSGSPYAASAEKGLRKAWSGSKPTVFLIITPSCYGNILVAAHALPHSCIMLAKIGVRFLFFIRRRQFSVVGMFSKLKPNIQVIRCVVLNITCKDRFYASGSYTHFVFVFVLRSSGLRSF